VLAVRARQRREPIEPPGAVPVGTRTRACPPALSLPAGGLRRAAQALTRLLDDPQIKKKIQALLPHFEQTAVPSSHFVGIGLDLVTALISTNDPLNGSEVSYRHFAAP
jgi:hypothetical protein